MVMIECLAFEMEGAVSPHPMVEWRQPVEQILSGKSKGAFQQLSHCLSSPNIA